MANELKRPTEAELRAFVNNSAHFTHSGKFFIEVTTDADLEGPKKNEYPVKDSVVEVDGMISNPSYRNPSAPIEVRGHQYWWKWPDKHVKALWTETGTILWVNNTYYPPPEKPVKKTRCQLAVEVLDTIVDTHFAIPSTMRNVDQLHAKNRFYGALKMIPCLSVGRDEWEFLRQCVSHNEQRLHLDSAIFAETLKWISDSEKWGERDEVQIALR